MKIKSASHPPEAWAHFIRKTRSFFEERGFIEVFTPSLVPAGAFENALDSIKVRSSAGAAELHTSPEMEMKALLAELKKPIFQICKCFRDDPDTSIHFTEFTMLEFYRPFHTYEATRKDMRDLLETLALKSFSFLEISIEDIFKKHTGIPLSELRTAPLLLKAARELGIQDLSEKDSWEDVFFRIMLERIEPQLDPKIPTLVFDYPASVSTLSQPKDSFWGERFELFWHGMELCNGATELLSKDLLKTRYDFESKERVRVGKTPHPFPERLYQALDHLPPCSGVAVGLDRLFWALQR